ncbi:MAG: hypothetical protein JWN03_1292 [Nocardia sp.]|nr:hypothetical protein [Nocardia sp.]
MRDRSLVISTDTWQRIESLRRTEFGESEESIVGH